jgi:hypothetical protein
MIRQGLHILVDSNVVAMIKPFLMAASKGNIYQNKPNRLDVNLRQFCKSGFNWFHHAGQASGY